MLHVFRSNRVEVLLEGLTARLAAMPPASPFAPEVVVAASPAMARWVNLHIARREGVAANLDYPLPAAFVWRLARDLLGDLPEADPLAREIAAWRIYALLPEFLDTPAFTPLKRYLRDDVDGIRRWQLCERIADVLDRYQLYRPEQVRTWDRGAGDDWQALLWRRLTAGLDGRHRVAVTARLLEALAGATPPGGLPERVSVFAVSTLPPLLVEVFHTLAGHRPVDLYLHAPTDAFWADLVSQKALARKRLADPGAAELWEVGHPLLSSWGRQGQALQDLLLAPDLPLGETDAFLEPPAESLLGRLQRDIFVLRPPPAPAERPVAGADGSLEVHVCHSALRECQVLHDRLLALFDADPGLAPEDVLVMIPEVDVYAPYVEAVFDQDGARARPFIPWNLSDISVRDAHPVVGVFLQLLDLPASRFSHSEVLSYLDVPELAGHFGLDGEAVSRVKAWLEGAHLRWGLDGEHKARLGLPPARENTWAQVGERLFAGYALGDAEPFAGIVPLAGVEGGEAEVLGRFWRLITGLAEAARDLARPRTAPAWRARLVALLAEFFGEGDDEEGRLQKLRDALADLGEQGGMVDEPLSRGLVRRWLEERLAADSQGGRYFSGGVSVCGMRPMRSLPFRVVCVLGLQEQAFPRRDRRVEFDSMAHSWRPGDPRVGDEDRYLFLETLMCARECLYLSYTGRDLHRNLPRQPSVLVAELLDTLDQYYRAPGAGPEALSERITRVHPLQPFAPGNFQGEAAGFDGDWCRVARSMVAATVESGEAAHWPGARLEDAPEAMAAITPDQLERFLQHPVRTFVTSRLQVTLVETEPPEDEEAFVLDGLAGYGLRRRLVSDHLRGQATAPARLGAEGVLPHGAFAEVALAAARQGTTPLLERLEPLCRQVPEALELDLEVPGPAGPLRLAGALPEVYPGLGLWRWRPGRLRGGDVLGLWLAHLARCAAGDGAPGPSRVDGLDEAFLVEAPVSPGEAVAALGRYLGWYWEGLHRPLPLLPRASYAYARAVGGRGDPMNAAARAWLGSEFNGVPGDGHDAYIQLVLRGVTGHPLEHPEFPELARVFYADALAAGVFR